MKKVIISAILILSFVVYIIYSRITGNQSGLKGADSQTNTTPSPSMTPLSSPTATGSKYKNGTYTGSNEDAFYGTIQVRAVISGGRLADVLFLQYPNDRSTSVAINNQADPMLAQEAIQIQNANVDIISGATDSSQAFIQSLQTALRKAQS